MLRPLRGIKKIFEEITGSRIYRHSLPHGIDCSFDIDRALGCEGIKTVFDVGANIGQSAIRYLREFPQAQIYSFEPVTATYETLVANTRRFSRIHSFKLGLGREEGQMTINVNPDSRRSSFKLCRPDDHPEIVTLSTVARFAEKQNLPEIDFLKIDAEGFDLDVLAGAVPLLNKQRVYFIQCECEPVARTNSFVSFSRLADFLSGYDYRLYGVYEQQPEFDGQRQIFFWNAVFVCDKLVPCGTPWPSTV